MLGRPADLSYPEDGVRGGPLRQRRCSARGGPDAAAHQSLIGRRTQQAVQRLAARPPSGTQ